MSTIKSWYPILGDDGNFATETDWTVIIRQLFVVLLTPKGTRQWQPEFGCDIRKFVFDNVNNTDQIKQCIIDAFRWLAGVTLKTCDVTLSPISGRAGYTCNCSLVISWNNESLPVTVQVPSSLDDLEDGFIYQIGVKDSNGNV